jgi:hypothetical protein
MTFLLGMQKDYGEDGIWEHFGALKNQVELMFSTCMVLPLIIRRTQTLEGGELKDIRFIKGMKIY